MTNQTILGQKDLFDLIVIMGIFGKVNFDNPSEKEEFNNIMENWMNRQDF